MSKLMIDKIYQNFDINHENGLYDFNKIDTIPNLPQRVCKSLREVEPNNLFVVNGKVVILFFNKDDKKKKEIFKKCWNFGEVPIVIIETETDFEIYNGFDYILKTENLFELELIKKDGLNYLSLISGTYFKDNKFKNKNRRVDKVLLENIKYVREEIIIKLASDGLQDKLKKLSREKNQKKKEKIVNSFTPIESKNLKSLQTIANSLIGRIIFIRYLVDREVELVFEGIKKSLTNEDLKTILNSKKRTYSLFQYLQSDDGFNGDWFPVSDAEKTVVKEEHLSVLKEFISGTKIKNGQRSLFDFYDFSIIPVEFISNIYESFIGEEQQKADGAYYTPTFLVDYVLKYTVDNYFENNPTEYNCRVLDPACGSGIFLVETLRKLVAQYEKVNKKPISAKKLKQLVLDNIYAIDSNPDALAISVFSLYITMLDYQNPKEIEEFKFPYLLKNDKNDNPNPNFFYNDFFDTDAEYNDILKNKKLHFIIGNPPYGQSSIKEGSLADEYIKNNKLKIGNGDIVQAFMIRVKDLVAENTKISFIVTSKVLYNLKTKVFRTEHFFNQFKVNHILELSSVRKEIFENADVPVSILFYEYSTNKEVLKNIINYISMKPSPYFKKLKVLILSKSDFKKVNQSKLLGDNDYLWKILVYGSYLDFNFIKTLKSNKYNTIQKLVGTKELIKYQGFKRKDGNKKIDTTRLQKFDFIDTGPKKKDLKPFYISSHLDKFNYDSVGYTNQKITDDYTDAYKAPILLFTGGLSNELKQNSAISYKNATFTSSVVALKSLNNNIDILKTINGLFYSNFFSYYLLQTASSTGVKQEECDDYEKLSLPYIKNKKIVSVVSKIEELKKEHFDTNSSNTLNYEKDLNSLTRELDETILKALNLNEKEYSLIDYVNSIVIPWVIQKKYDHVFKIYDYKNKKLEEYVNIFIKHYSNIYKQNDLFFQAEILWHKYAIGIYFKVLKEKPNEDITWKKESNIQNFLKLSSGETVENLFIQKDIKGFEPDGFYVVKPNEYKNWHKAIGYLDFYEFDDAILTAGK